MRRVLHLLSRADDEAAAAAIAADRAAGFEVEVVELQAQPVDYAWLLAALRRADAVRSW